MVDAVVKKVNEKLKILLEEHRAKCGNPEHGFIFSNEHGQPMNLEALAVAVIRPTLEKANLPWHGWHAFRRGLATNLHRLGVSDKVIKQILRHANVTTTMNIYGETWRSSCAYYRNCDFSSVGGSILPGASVRRLQSLSWFF